MDQILGHDDALDTLQRALCHDRVHHAWIFSGPAGVGKRTAAVEFARILLDPATTADLSGRIAADPDSATSALIDAGSHPDLHIIRKELAAFSTDTQLHRRKQMNIPIDVLREYMIGGTVGTKYFEPAVFHTPVRGHGKVFIIDEAERLQNDSQNALLKTLEEPSARTFLILVTSRPERLLPTVHSRCQHVRFAPLDDDAMATWFDRTLTDLDPDLRTWLGRYAAGSPGRAMLAHDFGFASWHATLSPALRELDAGGFDVDAGPMMADLVAGFAEAWVKRTPNASKDAANKDGAGHLFALLAMHVGQGLRQALDSGNDPAPFLARIDHLRDAERHLASNVNLKMVLENLAAQWSQPAVIAIG